MGATTESGVWIVVTCLACPKKFNYFKTSNVHRRLCEKCAESRTAKSKQRFEETKKKGVARNPEEAEASRILKHIPDAVNWNNILGKVAATC